MKYTSEQHLNRAQAAKRAAFKVKDETSRANLLRLSKVHRGLARAAKKLEQTESPNSPSPAPGPKAPPTPPSGKPTRR